MSKPRRAASRASSAPRAASLDGATAPAARGRVRRIVTITDREGSILRRRSRPVARVDDGIRRLVADMAVTMRRAEGVGLAAVQVGVPLRVLIADTGRGLLALVNPRIRRRSGAETGEEGCLSIPGVVATVPRARRIAVDATLLNGGRAGLRAEGYIARILQHEIDHLDGVLFLDRVRASAVRRRPLRPAERRRGVRTAAAAVHAAPVEADGEGVRRSVPRRPRAARAAARPWPSSRLTVVVPPAHSRPPRGRPATAGRRRRGSSMPRG
jgi:peptide deformylase